jgi:hypothetical protein
MFAKSWMPTLAGLMAAIGLTLSAMEDPLMKMIGTILAAVGSFLTGATAKQFNVTGGDKK